MNRSPATAAAAAVSFALTKEIAVPERHFETLRALINTSSVNTPTPGSCLTKRFGVKGS